MSERSDIWRRTGARHTMTLTAPLFFGVVGLVGTLVSICLALWRINNHSRRSLAETTAFRVEVDASIARLGDSLDRQRADMSELRVQIQRAELDHARTTATLEGQIEKHESVFQGHTVADESFHRMVNERLGKVEQHVDALRARVDQGFQSVMDVLRK